MWFRMMVRSGTALANSASSNICGKYIQPSRDRPMLANTRAPARKLSLDIWFAAWCAAVFSISGCGSQVTEWRMPRKRLGLAACRGFQHRLDAVAQVQVGVAHD